MPAGDIYVISIDTSAEVSFIRFILADHVATYGMVRWIC